ncbi:MAG: M48 family metalloprotease [Deltaproteobacteria bacterium]|nr:M48 family metalloprotease [Deltaproteobacteria bacterium]
MSTNFFENQDAARRNTKRLVALFGLAVIAIASMLYLLAVLITGVEQAGPNTEQMVVSPLWWQPDLALGVALATVVVVGGGSLYKIAQLRSGGSVVAEALGGALIPPGTRDADARRLLNVVEEMAIASGIPAPPVYLLGDEQGINAFAAGFSPGDAVIGVTRGCVQQLSRDELQGVIAHEFSHILSGDMGLNIRLMGVIHGILIIGIIGYFLLRSSLFTGSHRRSSSRDNNGIPIVAVGLGLMVIGFLGTFFGNLIKASVSRQREFFADASAVQFTRNPDGIAGALKQIGGYESGSILASPERPRGEPSLLQPGIAKRVPDAVRHASTARRTHPAARPELATWDPARAGSSDAQCGGRNRGIYGWRIRRRRLSDRRCRCRKQCDRAGRAAHRRTHRLRGSARRAPALRSRQRRARTLRSASGDLRAADRPRRRATQSATRPARALRRVGDRD